MAQFAFWARRSAGGPGRRSARCGGRGLLPARTARSSTNSVELLDDKRQIVLYGPPGTGKTFIARKLAEALAPADQLRRFVQFHPSTSYEDFFEGYRPDTDASGNLSYTLTSGPLRSARRSRSRRHAPARPGDRRAQPGEHPEGVRRAAVPARVPRPVGVAAVPRRVRAAGEPVDHRHDEHRRPLDCARSTRRCGDASTSCRSSPTTGRWKACSTATWSARAAIASGHACSTWSTASCVSSSAAATSSSGRATSCRADLDEVRMERIWRYNIEPLMDDLFYGDRATIDSVPLAQGHRSVPQVRRQQGRAAHAGAVDRTRSVAAISALERVCLPRVTTSDRTLGARRVRDAERSTLTERQAQALRDAEGSGCESVSARSAAPTRSPPTPTSARWSRPRCRC